MGTVLLEDSRRRKFSKLVPNHVFRDEHGVKDFAVVDEERVPHEVRRDCRTTRPCLDWLLDGAVVHFVDLFKKMLIDERSFFEGSAHGAILFLRVTTLNNEGAAALMLPAGLETLRKLTPRAHRMVTSTATL